MPLTDLKRNYNLARTPRHSWFGTVCIMAKAADNRFFRHLVTSMRNGVLAIAPDGEVVVVNPEARRILGLDPAEDGRYGHFAELLRDHPDLIRVLAGAFVLSHLPNRAELRLKPKGTVIGYTVSRIEDERGHVRGAALFFKDLTHVEQAAERERLRDRLAALGEMAATIAHEVKNPLASIEVMAGLVRRRLQDRPDLQDLMADIIGEAKMANAIVLEVLEFVRPIRLQLDRTDMARVIEDAIGMAEHKVPRGGTRIEVAVPDDLPALRADHQLLCQLVTNLLTNALEALAGRGTIRIRAGSGMENGLGNVIEVEVADDGPGIAEEVRERIFDPFLTTKPQGSGLGLAIVRKIVDAHEGRIDVTSSPGRGATFRIALPVAGPGHQGE